MTKYYKGFNKDMTCRGKQYAENTEYEEPRSELCEAGMHFCENPFDVLDYYPLVNDDGELITTAEVTPLAEMKSDGKKSVTTKLRIGAKLSFGAFVKAGIEFLLDKTTNKNISVYNAQIGSSGNWAKIGSSGDWTQIGSSGDWAQIGSSGNNAQIGSSGNGAQIGSSGNWAQIGSSGNWAQIASQGRNSVVCCAGNNCAVKAKQGSWITLAEWRTIDGTYCPVCVKTEYVDGDRIKPDTWYKIVNGEFVEVE